MKKYLKYILIISLLPVALSGNARTVQEQLTIKLNMSKAGLDSIQRIVNDLEKKKQSLQEKVYAYKEDSVRLSKEITKVQGAIEYIDEDPDNYKKIKYADLTQKLNEYKSTMVELSLRSLLLPYDEYYINEIAIPNIEKCKGSEAYKVNDYRRMMLKNYGKDWNNLKKFLTENKNTTYTSAGSVKDKLLNLPIYVQYAGGFNPNNGNRIPGYGKGWEQTYLGKIMSGLLKVLSDTSQKDATAKIISAFETYLNWMRE